MFSLARLFALGITSLLTLGLIVGCASNSVVPQYAKSDNSKACVVLVHGLWRSGFAMRSIESYLEREGFKTVTISYPSTSHKIPKLVDDYLAPAVNSCKSQSIEKIHIVSHSMGGVLARYYLQNHSLPQGSHVVMLSPPNQGSELSEKFGDSWWYQWIVGPAGSSLTQDAKGIIQKLKPVQQSIGIIAAFRNWSLWPSSWLPTPNDGTVSVESMKLPEMNDFVLIEDGHAMMRFNQEVLDQIGYYLNFGEFYQPDLESDIVDAPSITPLSHSG